MQSSRPNAEDLKQKSIVEKFLEDWIRCNDQSSIEWLLSQTSSGFDRIHAQSAAVILATKNGQLETLKWLVDVKHLTLDVRNNNGNNPVLLAAWSGHLETLKWLVDVKPLTLDVRNNYGSNPVLLTALSGQLETLKWLVDVKRLSLDVRNNNGNNPVLLAALNGQLETLKWLVDVKPLTLDVKDGNGNNPVLLAAWNGHLETLKWLVDVKGLTLDVKNNYGSNPVLYAALNGQLETLKWLIGTKKYSFNVSDNNACQILLEQSAKFKPEIFTYAFPHFLESLHHANHLEKALEVTEKQYGSLTEAAQRNQLDVGYEKFIDLNYPNPAYKTCLESYGRVNKTGALQCHISLLLRNNKPIEANALCLQTLQGDSTAAEKECAAINLAELIFQQNSDLIEEGSPLEGSSDPFLSADQSRIKRAIQAFYLLKDYQCEKALHLKQRLDQVLSGNNGPSGNTCSEKTWKERAFYYYAAYLLYKNNPRGEHLDKVMQRFTNESSQLVSKNSFFGSKNTPEKNACRSTRRLSL